MNTEFDELNQDEDPEDEVRDESPESEETPDTIPPSPEANHGFLEQFDILSAASVNELEKVCKLGLTPAERITIIKLSMRLLGIGVVGATPDDFSEEQQEELKQAV